MEWTASVIHFPPNHSFSALEFIYCLHRNGFMKHCFFIPVTPSCPLVFMAGECNLLLCCIRKVTRAKLKLKTETRCEKTFYFTEINIKTRKITNNIVNNITIYEISNIPLSFRLSVRVVAMFLQGLLGPNPVFTHGRRPYFCI